MVGVTGSSPVSPTTLRCMPLHGVSYGWHASLRPATAGAAGHNQQLTQKFVGAGTSGPVNRWIGSVAGVPRIKEVRNFSHRLDALSIIRIWDCGMIIRTYA